MAELKLGVLIDANQQRDAIHIAVAPVIAAERLVPGSHIGFAGNDTDHVTARAQTLIGIVDPFLKAIVEHGERCWMFLYPQTITSLRHDWTHPAFAPVKTEPAPTKSDSQLWIENFAVELDQTYSRLMAAAARWLTAENYTYDNSERYKRVDRAKWPEFWEHYEIVTGRLVNDHSATFFTCSC